MGNRDVGWGKMRSFRIYHMKSMINTRHRIKSMVKLLCKVILMSFFSFMLCLYSIFQCRNRIGNPVCQQPLVEVIGKKLSEIAYFKKKLFFHIKAHILISET